MIYFMRNRNLVKIGYAKRIEPRIASLLKKFPGSVLLKYTVGSYREELALHKKFSHLRTNGEWFFFHTELLAYIDSLETPITQSHPSEELEKKLGMDVRLLRLQQNIAQVVFAKQSGVSMTALRNLEAGRGATLSTFVRTLVHLGKLDWINSLTPFITVHPLYMVQGHSRLRATPRKLL